MKKRKARGSVLIIGLVLLTVLTLLAVTSMRMASIEMRIAGIIAAQRLAQNAAASMLESHFAGARAFNTTWGSGFDLGERQVGPGNIVTVESRALYVGAGAPPPGFSLSGNYAAYNFEIQTTARGTLFSGIDPLRGIQVQQTMGFHIIGPGR
ncbi:MAG: PilX N-terminal domain-containing pilus assembly protein [Gammaproteobacteria bacterium]|nr:PilX N-terminal domain-containing pilus assembly protein [Gammaproteobacteria bacterium]